MPRRREIPKKEIAPDPKFNSVLISKFINGLMLDGKKSTARTLFYGAMDLVEQRAKEDPVKVFERAMDNVRPAVEVRSRRVGGATYQVPMEVRMERKRALAIRWIVGFARKRGEKTMTQRLAGEILDASQEKGAAFKKKEDTHKMAEANKAFAHYRW
jgi:small subunit ribosomal protein S7